MFFLNSIGNYNLRLMCDSSGDCRDVVRCDRAGIAGTIRLASIRCPSGLAFDLGKQICDWKAKVQTQDNCLPSLSPLTTPRCPTVTSCPSLASPSPTLRPQSLCVRRACSSAGTGSVWPGSSSVTRSLTAGEANVWCQVRTIINNVAEMEVMRMPAASKKIQTSEVIGRIKHV